MSTEIISGNVSRGQTIYRCDNGYGASVVCHSFSYGYEQGLKELAVLKFSSPRKWQICYDTPITDDVFGWLEEHQVSEILGAIEHLQPHGEYVP